MRITQVKISNFRSYKDETVIDFNDLTVFIGKNDAGKSTVLEALDIFFNEGKGAIKLDKEDINKSEVEDKDISITVVFDHLPPKLVLDEAYETTLEQEYLLNNDEKIEIVKTYPSAGKEKVFIKANHPTNDDCKDLLLKKNADLKKILKEKDIACDNQTKNAVIRKAIWDHYSNDLQLNNIEIESDKEDAKKIWDKLKNYMPLYALFQSDRKNSDGDSEIQDPMKLAVNEILKNAEIQESLNSIANEINKKLDSVAAQTLEKLKEMDENIAKKLKPVIPTADRLKWADVFRSVSISGDDGIPINKRGSGVKRLVLLNFFRAEAERRRKEKNDSYIIYAIEEPETSQHPEYQQKLIKALKELSESNHAQVMMTTHSPAIVKQLDFEDIRLVQDNQKKRIVKIEKNNLPYTSLNEVNFLAFDESTIEYHNELYAHIEEQKWLNEFIDEQKSNRGSRSYRRDERRVWHDVFLSKYIRHQIHHPENKLNEKFTPEELKISIEDMRCFIKNKKPLD